jgi:hypothetical protein
MESDGKSSCGLWPVELIITCSDGSKNASHDMGYLYEACDQISDFCHQ